VRAAASAFEAIAARGDKGWGDEAKSRATALRTTATSDDVKGLMQKSAAARAQGKTSLADAYVDEARLLMR
jgi:hypothetical protein